MTALVYFCVVQCVFSLTIVTGYRLPIQLLHMDFNKNNCPIFHALPSFVKNGGTLALRKQREHVYENNIIVLSSTHSILNYHNNREITIMRKK